MHGVGDVLLGCRRGNFLRDLGEGWEVMRFDSVSSRHFLDDQVALVPREDVLPCLVVDDFGGGVVDQGEDTYGGNSLGCQL